MRIIRMSFALIYWIIYLFALVFGFWGAWPNWRTGTGNLPLLILLMLLGWRVFGAPVQG